MADEKVFGTTVLRLVRGDITREETDAIVNAANSRLMGGGGVDGAIHRAGGPAILEACKEIVAASGPCATGEAVMTTGGRLPARFVIHTVGPVWHGGGRGEDALLENAYRNSIRLAVEHELHTMAFPSISTGAYRFPLERAARIALRSVGRSVSGTPIKEVRFVLFSEHDLDIYRGAMDELH